MFNTFLFITLLLIFIFVLLKTKREISSPATLFTAGFLISSFFLMINTNNWSYSITSKTYTIVVSAVVVFLLGSLLYSFVFRNNNSPSNDFTRHSTTRIHKAKHLRTRSHLIILCLIILCLIIRLMDLSLTVGSINIFGGVLNTYRHLDGRSRLASLISFCTPMLTACLIFETVELVEMFVEKQKKRLLPVIVVILSIFYYMMSSARIEMLYTFIYLLSFIFIALKHSRHKIGLRSTFIVISLAVLFFVSFFLAGYLTGKSQKQVSAFDNISLYAGSSLATFDDWLKTFSYDRNNFGMTIFRGIHNLLNLFGVKTKETYSADLGFRNIGTMLHSSNVYSCLPELISDVGFIGLYIVLFFEGFLSTALFSKTISEYKQGRHSLIYVYIYLTPVIAFSSISERYFRVFLTLSTLVFIIVVNFLKLFKRSSEIKQR